MAHIKTFGLVLLVGALTCYLVARESGLINKNQTEVEDFQTAQNNHWGDWKSKHHFKFGAAEDPVRRNWFQKHSDWVSKHNSRKNKTYEVEINEFAAFTDEEFAALYLGDFETAEVNPSNVKALDTPLLQAASSIDWTTKGAVTPVKNQGQCGSCWSFSATGALEGFKAVKDGKLVTFSEQQLIDCSGSYGNNACSGGLALRAFTYVKDNGIVESSAYSSSYKAAVGTCNIPASASRFKVSGYIQVPVDNLAQMQAALNKQPLAVSVQGDTEIFKFYKSGILDDAGCGTAINHAVLAVGYEAGKYWKVKNSWGTGWGQNGYIQIAMQDGLGVCGINKRVTYPIA